MEFRPSEFEDSAETLFKLQHTGSIHDYISEFRHLATRSLEVGLILLKSCFIWGLKKELKFVVKLLKPISVHDAISITMQLNAKLAELKPSTQKYTTAAKSQYTATTVIPHSVPHSSNFPSKKLSPKEKREMRVMVL